MSITKKLIDMVMAHEGTYDSVNRNSDGAGVSVGIFQWPQRTGGLSMVLNGYYRANPELFKRIFGDGWKGLLEHAASRSMAPLEGALLWQEPWVSRFVQAGRQADFRAVQDRLATDGPFLKAAFKGAKAMGFTTERSLAVVLDAAVSQGPDYAVAVAREVRQAFADQTVAMRDVLEDYLRRSVDHFHSRTQPPPSRSKHT